MPRFLTSHTMACMTRQDLQHLVTLLSEAGDVHFLRLLVNMTEGKLFGEFQAPGRDALMSWMGHKKIHHDWVVRVDIEATAEGTKDL